MNSSRKIVLFAAAILFLVWGFLNFGRLTADQEGLIRLVLGALLALAILFRWKPVGEGSDRRPWLAPAAGVVGVLLVVIGVVLGVHQAEWLGVILLLYACLRWALPKHSAGDVALALLLLYWVHPLPGQVFSKFQFVMQSLSVKGAEWLLHCLNVRVWADDFILHTGLRMFGVPEACSGMRTAVTVFLCTLGVCVLFRHRWPSTVFMIVAGLIQVLMLNILRITLVVYFAPRMPEEWGETALHDTAGLFLLVSIVLTQFEASWWKLKDAKRRQIAVGRRVGDVEHAERAFKVPRFWHFSRKVLPMVALVLLAGAVLAAGLYKSRPSHRRTMRREVIDRLMDHDRATAFRAVEHFLAQDPTDRELLSKKAEIQISRQDYEAALKTIESLPGELANLEKVAKSWALMALKRPEEAVAVIETLPNSVKRIPSVAIIRAQYGALMGQLDEVVENIVIAVESHRTLDRVRSLFPYLALHEQWDVIARCDRDKSYQDVTHALIALQAQLKTGNHERAGVICRKGIERWPDETRFLPGLFALALNRPGGEWEDLLADNLKRNLRSLDADLLASFMNYSFRLARPDLAWTAYYRLREIDERDPDLLLLPARFGDVWFRFQRHRVGAGGSDAGDVLDLSPLYRQTRDIWPLARAWRRVPLTDDITAEDLDHVRKLAVETCVAELTKRADEGLLTQRMYQTFVDALAATGELEDAHRRLDEAATAFPEIKAWTLLRHAGLYNAAKLWPRSYEALREWRDASPAPSLQADLMLVNALVNMNLGVCALDIAQRAVERYPGVPRAAIVLASVWNFYGHSEQAYAMVSRHSWAESFPSLVQLLYETGRYREAEKKSRALQIPIFRAKDKPPEVFSVPPAERVLARQWPEPLTLEEMNQEAALAEKTDVDGSPFVRALAERTTAWYRAGGGGAASDSATWAAIGRDDLEKAAALHRLAALLARQHRYEEALEAADAALSFLPRSAMLHRIIIALTEGAQERVEAARKACPEDPDVWLAGLVSDVRAQGSDWSDKEVRQAVTSGVLPVGTSVRAGDFLLREGPLEAASRLARYALERARGFLPAYALGLRCAVRLGDREWALKCAHDGIEQAGDPTTFYRCIALVKDAEEGDGEMVRALEYLQEHLPEEPAWGEELGSIYFDKGERKRALSILASSIESGAEKARAESFLLASEAARVEGDPGMARRFLEKGYTIYPDRLSILNNLIYNLAQQPATVGRAKALLPKLLEMESESAAVLDTAAVVCLKTGDLDSALKYSKQALQLLEEDNYAALEIRLNAAQILFRAGQPLEARRRIEEIRKDSRCKGRIDYESRLLLEQINLGSQ